MHPHPIGAIEENRLWMLIVTHDNGHGVSRTCATQASQRSSATRVVHHAAFPTVPGKKTRGIQI